MRFYYDKQIQGYAIFLASFLLFIFIISFFTAEIQDQRAKDRFIAHENEIVSSLLDQGVTQDAVSYTHLTLQTKLEV